jgi:hypothetical protein
MIYTSLFINLFMCLLLLNFQWREQKAILYLCLILIIFNKRQITELLLNSDSDGIVLTQIIFLTDPIGYLIGPLTLYYFKSLVAKKFVINYRLIWLCLPSLLIAINIFIQRKIRNCYGNQKSCVCSRFPKKSNTLF